LIALFSPLGSQVASISTTPEGVTLTTSDGKAYYAQDAASLTQQNLGWSLPMKGLPDWVLGRPTNSVVELTQWDETGYLVRLKQDGWDIEYAQYIAVNGYQLPGKVTLRSLKVNLKLIIEQWHMTDESLVLHEVK
jgi:outer membrane lipoprotein LolB